MLNLQRTPYQPHDTNSEPLTPVRVPTPENAESIEHASHR